MIKVTRGQKIAGAMLAVCCMGMGELLAAGLEVRDPWVRPGPPGVQVMAAYMTLENTGDKAKTLVGVASPASARVELHQTVQRNGMATMEPVPMIEIPSKGKLVLEPGGYHLMLLGLSRPVMPGEKIPFAFIFTDGERKEVMAEVRQPAAPEAAVPAGSHDHDPAKHDHGAGK